MFLTYQFKKHIFLIRGRPDIKIYDLIGYDLLHPKTLFLNHFIFKNEGILVDFTLPFPRHFQRLREKIATHSMEDEDCFERGKSSSDC
jgi:hypothetical protein